MMAMGVGCVKDNDIVSRKGRKESTHAKFLKLYYAPLCTL